MNEVMSQLPNIEIAATQSSPEVFADTSSGVLTMRGDSYPENSFEFFAPIIEWIERMLEVPEKPIHLDLHLLYLNTSSVKAMMDIFEILERAHGAGHAVSVKWSYAQQNSRIADLAEEFREDCTFAFEIVQN